MPAARYLDGFGFQNDASSGRFAEGSTAAGKSFSPFGNVSNYGMCGCCGSFHAVFEGGDIDPLNLTNADDRGGFGSNGRRSLGTSEAGAELTRGNLNWAGGAALGQPLTITYAFRSTAPTPMPEDTTGFSRFTDLQISATLQALASWSDVANITFQRVSGAAGDADYSNDATILFGNYSSGQSGAAAFAYSPGNRNISSNSGDVWINSSLSYNQTPVPLQYGQQVLTHEIGHVLGLRHPASYNASEGTTITYANDAGYFEDSRQYTVMSYFSERNTGADFGNQRYSAVPLLDDIAAIQRLHGANMSTRTGDTVYGFNSNAGQAWFSATASSSVLIFAIWDAGGADTLDFSGYGQTQTIDLRQGAFSSVGGLTGNVAIALGAVIENAIGGSNADRLIGNSGSNVLTGNGGNDFIDGGLGSDTAVFDGNLSEYTIARNGQTITITHNARGEIDTVVNVELLKFRDQTIASGATGGLTLSGDILDNVLSGTADRDILFGLGGNDTLNGNEGNDSLDGGSGNDAVNGGNGNDLIIGGLGSDRLDGGAGTDTVDYAGAGGSVQVSLATNSATGAAGNDTLSGFEDVNGSAFNDVLTGDAQANVIRGGGGVDTLNGGGGNDTLIAGAAGIAGGADDIVKGETVINNTIATAVNTAGRFDLQARSGVENATTIPHATILGTSHGGVEYYAVTVAAGDIVRFDIDNASFDSALRLFDAAGVELSQNDDAPTGSTDSGEATDSVINYTFATAGTYYIQVSQWVSNTTGGAFTSGPVPTGANYQLNISVPSAAVVPTIALGSTLNGDLGNDTLTGGAGADTLNGGEGSDVIDGGAGTDTLILSGTAQSYTYQRVGSTWRVTDANGSVDTVSNVEQVSFAGAAAVDLERAFGSNTTQSIDPYSYIAGYPDLLAAFRNDPAGAVRHYETIGRAEGRLAVSFDGLRYVASHSDLIRALGADSAAGARHYVLSGSLEGRQTSTFNPSMYTASHPDLARLYGTDGREATIHYINIGFNEGRAVAGFNALLYAASNPDLARAFGADQTLSLQHYLNFGADEGRPTSGFNALLYTASHADLARPFGTDQSRALQHYLDFGADEGRATSGFNALIYSASHADLARAFGTDQNQALQHYLNVGADEGRAISGFNALIYAATHLDLARFFGADANSSLQHYLGVGADEGRSISGFDSVAYLLTYPDLAGQGAAGALNHWLAYGADEGRLGDARFGRDQSAHQFSGSTTGVLEQAADRDWFQTSYSGGNRVTIALSGSATAVELYDSLGNRIPSAPGQAGNVFNIATTGAYFVVVSGSAGSFTVSTVVANGSAIGSPLIDLDAKHDEMVSWTLPGLGEDTLLKEDADVFVLPMLDDLAPLVLPTLDEMDLQVVPAGRILLPTANAMLTILPDDVLNGSDADVWHRFNPDDGWMMQ